MAITIKEIHVKTTIEKGNQLPFAMNEMMQSLKKDIIREIQDSHYPGINRKRRKDR